MEKSKCVQVGREFEKEAFIFLNNYFDLVKWLSKNKKSPFDFRCLKGEKAYYGEAKVSNKTSKPSLNNSQKEADFVVVKSFGKIRLIFKKDFDKEILISNSSKITIYPSKELRNLIRKEAEKQHRYINNLILFILEKYFENKREIN